MRAARVDGFSKRGWYMRMRFIAVSSALAVSCLSVVGTSAIADDSDTQPETLQIDPDARVESDDIVTDDPTDEEDVSLPPIDGVGDSYVVTGTAIGTTSATRLRRVVGLGGMVSVPMGRTATQW